MFEIDLEKARMIKQIGQLNREILRLTDKIDGMCENCEVAGSVEYYQGKLATERKRREQDNSHASNQYRELQFEFESCQERGERCRIENRKLKRGY